MPCADAKAVMAIITAIRKRNLSEGYLRCSAVILVRSKPPWRNATEVYAIDLI